MTLRHVTQKVTQKVSLFVCFPEHLTTDSCMQVPRKGLFYTYRERRGKRKEGLPIYIYIDR
jgi:hypothetical protein